MVSHSKGFGNMLPLSPGDGAATDQVVGEVMAHQPITGTGRESGSPEMGTETRTQALRGAAVAKTPQCTKV